MRTVKRQANVQYEMSGQKTNTGVDRNRYNDSSDNESEIQIEDNESSTLLGQDNENSNILDEDMIYETEEEEPTSTIPWLLYTIKKYLTCQL